MTLENRRSAMLAAMGIENWRVRVGASNTSQGASGHTGLPEERLGEARPWNAASMSMPVVSVRAPSPVPPPQVGSTPRLADAELEPTRARVDAALTAAEVFEAVSLRLWRTGRALFIVSADDVPPLRFLGDLQRAVDRAPGFGLRDVPPFTWPPRDRPELGNAASLRSAWGALLRRVHREQPLSLVLVFGAHARPRLADVARLTEEAAAIDPSPRVHVAPLLAELLDSGASRRALWTGLRGW